MNEDELLEVGGSSSEVSEVNLAGPIAATK